MICRVCLDGQNSEGVIHIFQDEGIELNVAKTLAKYFWFEPKSDDPISTVICNFCWENVSSFHNFYLVVEKAHKLLSERFSLLSVERMPIEAPEFLPKQEALEDLGSSDLLQAEEALTYSSMGEMLEISNAEEEELEHEEEEYIEDYLVADMLQHENITGDDDIVVEDIEPNKSIAETKDKENAEIKEQKLHNHTSVEEKNIVNRCKKSRKPKPTATESSNEHKRKRGRPRKHKVDAPLGETQAERESYLAKISEWDEKIAQNMHLLCDICGEEFPKFVQLRDHMGQNHGCRGYATCCEKKFYKRTLLIDHIEKHLNPNYHKCDECNKEFADKQCLRNHHLLKHQSDEAKHFQCEHCPKRFAKPYFLTQHKVIHFSRTHNCDECGKSFPTATLLRAHYKAKHMNIGTMCDICAKVIRGRAAFRKHQLEHDGVSPPRVQCDICGSWHKDKYSLQKHKRRHNEEGTLHVCNYCDKVAPNRSALLSHQRYVHLNVERNFKCSVCSKAFKKALNLREHMATHTGEVLYNCPHCTKTFNSNANMHSHRKKMHPKEFEETRQRRRKGAGTMQPHSEETPAEAAASTQEELFLEDSELLQTAEVLA